MSKLEYEIANRFETPPGGWYHVAPTGVVFNTYSYPKWIQEISDHYIANNIPITADFEAELQDDLCRRHPEWKGICKRVPEPKGKVRVSFKATLSFVNMLVKWLLDGRPTVSQEEAEERAAICATCPFNRPMSWGCGLCQSQLTEALLQISGSKKTSLDDRLGVCAICSCSLRAAIHFPIESQKPALSKDMWDELKAVQHCWKGAGLEKS